ncbi:MAG: hypothetical protein ACT4PM_03615 [Gemmatimonadales bacterium]
MGRPHLPLALLLLSVCGLGYALRASPAFAQAGGSGMRYVGVLRIGNRRAPSGTRVTVRAWRGATDTGVCGSGTTAGDGSYSIEVPARAPECVHRTALDGPLLHMFVVNGENVSGTIAVGASLDLPGSLGRTTRYNLRATDVWGLEGSSAGDPLRAFKEFLRIGLEGWSARDEAVVVGVRYYGILRLGNQRAPVGTTVTVWAIRGRGADVPCGSGSVREATGAYWLDVPANAQCVHQSAGDAYLVHVFFVNGENVSGTITVGASLDLPASLGLVARHELRARGAPSPR